MNENLNNEPEKTSNTTVAPPPQSKPHSRVSATRSKPAVAQDAVVSASAPTGRAGDKPPPRARTVSMTARPTAATTSPIHASHQSYEVSCRCHFSACKHAYEDTVTDIAHNVCRRLWFGLLVAAAEAFEERDDLRLGKTFADGIRCFAHFHQALWIAYSTGPFPSYECAFSSEEGLRPECEELDCADAVTRFADALTYEGSYRAAAGDDRKKKMAMLGIGTLEVERWIQAGKGKGKERGQDNRKRVGFVDSDDEGELSASKVEAMDDNDFEEELSAEEQRLKQSLSMQITPRRPAGSVVPSPPGHSVLSGSPGAATGAQGLLHSLIKDAMVHFRQETKAEMVGLHVDLLGMGRSWR
ncbi:hypothetical protein EW146_g9306 [Bondarzewia mesenterica]|uniref:Uncharacterized protein n=1 Tax=Bondarzewia mesenterica TaxID=1095465 RepID=A0A4S4L9D0_9AGAM|nr:hypothetical protein EW146_g9306 [Bondarzewia mesenterica]